MAIKLLVYSFFFFLKANDAFQLNEKKGSKKWLFAFMSGNANRKIVYYGKRHGQ